MGAFGSIQNMVTQLANNKSMLRPPDRKRKASSNPLEGMYIQEKELSEEEWTEVRDRIHSEAARRRRTERIMLFAGLLGLTSVVLILIYL